jgi:hypothetical protein
MQLSGLVMTKSGDTGLVVMSSVVVWGLESVSKLLLGSAVAILVDADLNFHALAAVRLLMQTSLYGILIVT